MMLTAALIITLSAFLHAGWNLMGKRGLPGPQFFLVATLTGALCLLPLLVIFRSALGFFSPDVWLLLVCTGLSQTVYYMSLAGAYRTGAMSVAYPPWSGRFPLFW